MLHVDVYCDNLHLNPQCFHGPSLRFKRRGGEAVDYFACSACRDRKYCSFYLKSTDKNTQSERAIRRRKETVNAISYKNLITLRKTLKKLPPERRGFCHSCNVLFDTKLNETHSSCVKMLGLSNNQLRLPTEICRPKENDKVEAQYFFNAATASFVLKAVQDMNAQRVLCVGTPRLHEMFLSQTDISSLLLDIDPKYLNFYSKKHFIWYNMFNHFAMDERRLADLNEYIQAEGKMVLLIDPPFGGRVEPIAETLAKIKIEYNAVIKRDVDNDVSVMWFFPYFMERHIRDTLPHFRMLDFEVNYENHNSFSDTGPRRRKAGSPVRIFTNISLALFDLSTVPGYKYCQQCGFWVSEKNTHCSKCKSCSSKNGMRYIHCDLCASCVKPSYSHCETCRRCCLPSHVCGAFKPDTNCYHCHLPGHKKANCPVIHLHKNKKARVIKK